MGRALFYHLTRSPAESLAPVLIDKAVGQGWRVELRAADAARSERFDLMLWQREGFLPHGRAGGAHDARQPVLLTVCAADAMPAVAGNAPACLIALDGAAVAVAECEAMARVCILFDGADPAALDRARGQWRTLTAEGITAEYWAEDEGGWRKRQTSGG